MTTLLDRIPTMSVHKLLDLQFKIQTNVNFERNFLKEMANGIERGEIDGSRKPTPREYRAIVKVRGADCVLAAIKDELSKRANA